MNTKNIKTKYNYESLSKDLDLAINELDEAKKQYGDSFVLHKEIRKIEKKIKKDPTLEKDSELKAKLNDLKSKKHNVSIYEQKVYVIFKHSEKIINNLDKVKNKADIKIVDYDKKIKGLQKKITDKENPNILEEKISNSSEKIKAKKQLLKENPSNVAIKIDIYQDEKKKKKLEKRKAHALTLDVNFVNSEIDKYKAKRKPYRTKSNKINLDIKKYLDLYNKSKKALSNDIKARKSNAFTIEDLNVFYGHKQALYNVNIDIPKNKVIAIIGPSGCGKSTFLRTLNRINDEITGFRAEGKILFDGEYDIYKLRSIRNKFDRLELTSLRTKVGMIFQQPNPFPMSIYKNVSYGPKVNGVKHKSYLNDIVKDSLVKAALWDEVKENLNVLGTSLSGGQQQRLCIARAIANNPEILLMDEPTSALDPIASSKIENLILQLKEEFTIILVTHSLQQAARVSDYTAFFYDGKLIEFGETKQLFSEPKKKRTDDYIRGKFG